MVRRSSRSAGCAMSPLMRSKPESESSPVNGDAPDPVAAAQGGGADADPAKTADKPRPRDRTAIDLEVARGRSISWTIFGIVFGALLIWQLGTVGRWAGVVLIVMGVFHAVKLVQTL